MVYACLILIFLAFMIGHEFAMMHLGHDYIDGVDDVECDVHFNVVERDDDPIPVGTTFLKGGLLDKEVQDDYRPKLDIREQYRIWIENARTLDEHYRRREQGEMAKTA